MIKEFLNLLYPPNIYCNACGNLIDNSRVYCLCDECMGEIEWQHNTYSGGLIVCAAYNGKVRRLLRDFKYRGRAYYGDGISKIMYDRIRHEKIEPEVICPVPLHKAKLRKRGYNQAAVIAGALAGHMGIGWHGEILRRTRATVAMSNLGEAERRSNLEGVFALDEGKRRLIEGRRVLLVDDVSTTGSTALACEKVLKNGGALETRTIVFAKTLV